MIFGKNKNNILLSASLIVRNEEKHLEQCLQSIQPLVDEIVIVDTGSVDNTVAIAQRFNARLYHTEWQDDFALARNTALDYCRGEWILYIDADERVKPESLAGVRESLASSLAGCYVWLHPRKNHTAYREMRLFRNKPKIRFEGVIHENIWPALNRYIAVTGKRIGKTELTLDHVGYDGDQTHKHYRNLPLLLQKVVDDPDHAFSWWHLGAVYQGLGQLDKAEDAWCSGVAAARRRSDRKWAYASVYIGLITLLHDQPDKANPLLEEAMQRYPGHPQLVWLKGLALVRDRHFTEALKYYGELANWHTRSHETDGIVAIERNFCELTAHDGLATCYFRLGDYAKALEHYAIAAQKTIDNTTEYRVKMQLCKHLLAQASA